MNNDTLLQELRTRGYANDEDDAASGSYKLLANVSNVSPGWEDWSDDRQILAAKQVVCYLFFRDKQVDVAVGNFDGLTGPLTRNALDTYDRMKAGGTVYDRPEPAKPALPNSHQYVVNTARRNALPTQAQMMQYYGQPGENQVEILLPYKLRLSWDTDTYVSKMTCHKRAADDYQEIFEAALNAYGYQELVGLGLDLWGGTLNVRKMRGGTSWSMHSWGCATDIDPDHNDLKTSWKNARMSGEDYVPYVNCWLNVGWISLGYDCNFDSMHFQRARIR